MVQAGDLIGGKYRVVRRLGMGGMGEVCEVVHEMVGQRFGCTTEEVLFVSSNGWDAAGATGFGFTTAWVNRAGLPVDRLPWTPAHILSDLTAIPDLAARTS